LQFYKKMIQRIQSLFLICSIIITAVLPFFFSLWTENEDKVVYFNESILYIVFFAGISALAALSLFLFKKRQTQFVLNRLAIIFNFILLGFFVFRTLNLSGEMQISEKGIGMFLPTISIVLLVLANRAIKKDEDLVKSVDRLR
jgi:peptidoglycan/LPS O-acetylase OafA/YrhL